MTSASTLSLALRSAAADHGGRVALVDGADRRSWVELEEAVTRVAARLEAAGVVRGDHVALYRGKGAAAIVAIHATQWLGAAVVPIDPFAPVAHVHRVLTSARPAATIVDERTRKRLEAEATTADLAGRLLDLELDADDGSDEHVVSTPRSTPSDPAYVIFTSGSTGDPKGIVHTHTSALAYATRAAQTYDVGVDDVCAGIAPLHFDQSTFDLYVPPLVGASTVVISELQLRFPAELVAEIARTRCTIWYSVPTVIQQAVDRGAIDQHDCSSLRWVKFGGEAVAPAKLRAAMQAFPSARFSNVYGPAEVNQCAHHHLDGPPLDDEIVPIGRSWDGTSLRLRSEAGVIDGPGRGVLDVASPTAMLGYLDDPTRTAGAFDIDADGTRWYRTGDLVERDENGLLRFHGRTDRQIKIRGNRVELESVEIALHAVPGVRHAAAVVHGDGAEARLVGLVEADDIAPRAVIRSLATELPAASVPDAIVVRDALPRTGSGKIDARAALRLLESDVSPRSDRGPTS